MDRRAFVTLVAGTCLLESLAVRAQQTGKVFRIGLLAPYTEPTPGGRVDLEGLRLGLRDLGWVEGKNLVIEIRWAGENPQRQRELAAELKALPVALILAFGTAAIRAARDGAPGLPIVMINAGDPARWRPDRHFGGRRRGSSQTSGVAVGCRATTQEGWRADERRQPCQRILL
jgi:putative ABC transport system substrate-binding protein